MSAHSSVGQATILGLITGLLFVTLSIGIGVLVGGKVPAPRSDGGTALATSSYLLAAMAGLMAGPALASLGARYIATRLRMPRLVTFVDQTLIVLIIALASFWLVTGALGLSPVDHWTDTIDPIVIVIVFGTTAIISHFVKWILTNRQESFASGGVPILDRLVLPDHPIMSEADDTLGRKGVVDTLLRVIDDLRVQRNSTVVALNGKWGAGKTSVLELCISHLREKDGYLVVSFDPWHFESQATILSALLRSLSAEISRHYLLPDFDYSVSQYAKALAPTFTKIGLNLDPLRASDVERCRQQLLRLTAFIDRHIVIILDDLDRLQKAELLTVLQILKLSAGLTNVTYVVSLDRSYVERFVLGENTAGYLEKFIDIDLSLDYSENKILLDSAIDGIVSSVSSKPAFRLTGTRGMDEFIRALRPRPFSTMREAKRFVNAFRISFEMVPGELNVRDLVCLELIRSYSLQAWRYHLDPGG